MSSRVICCGAGGTYLILYCDRRSVVQDTAGGRGVEAMSAVGGGAAGRIGPPATEGGGNPRGWGGGGCAGPVSGAGTVGPEYGLIPGRGNIVLLGRRTLVSPA